MVIERLDRVGLSLKTLQQQLLDSLSKSSPHLQDFWSTAFQIRDVAIAVSPLTSGMPLPVVGNDDVLKKGVKDSLGADREAQAFAGLTVSKHFDPPLAVGIFGDWGSGKSFFMKLVYEHIERLSRAAKQPNGPKEFLGDIVQIRFNAWHYVDTNLWASLVDHIFTELDRSTDKNKRDASKVLFEQLSTARELTIESAERLIERRKEQAVAAESVADAERKLRQKQSSIGTSAQVYWKAVTSEFVGRLTPDENKSLKKAADRLAIPKLMEDGKLLNDAVQQLEDQRGRANLLAAGLRNQLGSWGSVAIFLGASLGIAAALLLLRHLLAQHVDADFIKEVWTPSVTTASSTIAAIASVFATASRQVKSSLDSLQSLRDKFNAATEAALKTPSDDVKAKQQELARLTAEVEEGRARLAASTEKLGEAAREYNLGTGRGRLLNFVRSRAANKDYAKHLGLVATIRRDFEELSDLIAAASLPSYVPEPELLRERAAYADRVDKLLKLAGASAEPEASAGTEATVSVSAKGARDAVTVTAAATGAASDAASVAAPTDAQVAPPGASSGVGADANAGTSKGTGAIQLLTKEEQEKLRASKEIKAPGNAPALNRIVLYVDDLDRCKPEKVAEVLQAVHLLLSFRLFVVFVAVDVRWVTRALRSNYPNLLSKSNEVGGASGATAHDYLEKIFQIPYWVRPMTDKSSEAFMADRLKGQRETLETLAAKLSAGGGQSDDAGEDENAADFSINEAEGSGSSFTPSKEMAKQEDRPQSVPHVDLDEDEVAFMIELARWAGNSPRRLLRFMNVYQVIKASLSLEDAAANKRGGSFELIAQVAIATAVPQAFDDWLKLLQDESPGSSISSALAKWKSEKSEARPPLAPHLEGILGVMSRRRPFATLGDVKRAALLTQRFSFGAEPLDLGPDMPASA